MDSRKLVSPHLARWRPKIALTSKGIVAQSADTKACVRTPPDSSSRVQSELELSIGVPATNEAHDPGSQKGCIESSFGMSQYAGVPFAQRCGRCGRSGMHIEMSFVKFASTEHAASLVDKSHLFRSEHMEDCCSEYGGIE
eukprot:5816739-Amphidinium_carterae.1